MSTTSMSVRRVWWLACVAAAALLVWIVVSGQGEDTGPPSTSPSTSRPTVLAAVATPGAAPSSGPTGTPSPGSLDEVRVEEAATAPPVPLTAPADFGTGLRLRILRIESVHGVARGPGEIAGPALRLTLRMTNDADSAVSLEGAVVDVVSGASRTPATTLSGPGARPFQGEVAAGGSMKAVYVFAVPVDERDRLRVAVSYLGSAPVVVLAGAAR